jgi:hypothetical protein
LSRDSAAEVIERIDRGDDAQEILRFVYSALRGSRPEVDQTRRQDDGA